MLTVLAVGAFATVQDAGRPGWTALGVPRSGAFDLPALRAANRLVGNDPDRPGVELVLGGLQLRTDRAVTVALTGAPCPGAGWGVALTLPAGGELRLGRPGTGLRSYLAVRGGIDLDPELGSGSTDTLSGLGPPPLSRGDRLAVGRATGMVGDGLVVPPRREDLLVRLGPRDDWFTAAALAALTDTAWRVRSECDRVGVRLDGPPLERARGGGLPGGLTGGSAGELPSEPVLPGAVQVPGDGRPIVFGPDAPVTGGYPVIGVVANLAAAAQLRPGDDVRFRILR